MTRLGSGESQLETMISYLLVIGVVTSIILDIIGIALYYGAYGNVTVSQTPNVFIHGENFFAFIYNRIQSLLVYENAVLFMTLGLIVLILTPFIRAITSVVYFAWEKNYRYVLITLFVLIVLTISLALH